MTERTVNWEIDLVEVVEEMEVDNNLLEIEYTYSITPGEPAITKPEELANPGHGPEAEFIESDAYATTTENPRHKIQLIKDSFSRALMSILIKKEEELMEEALVKGE